MEKGGEFSNIPAIKTEYTIKDCDETQDYQHQTASESINIEEMENKNSVSSFSKFSLPKIEQNLERDKKDDCLKDSEECIEACGNTQSPTNGSEMPPANHYLRNAILDEVLSEKKMALLWSPQVIKFLQEQQIAKRTNF